MNLLAIETSGATSSVALMRGGVIVAERSFPSRMTLNQRLADEIAALAGVPLAGAGLDGLAVGIGPGSFTGVRMGVALAKAVAHALALPLGGVSAPEAITVGLDATPGGAVCVLQRARADEVYVTALEVGEHGQPVEVGATTVLTLARALRHAEDVLGRPPEIVAGDAVAEHAAAIVRALPDARLADHEQALPRAAAVARVAAARGGDISAAFALTPRYVSLSQAEREFGVDLGLRG